MTHEYWHEIYSSLKIMHDDSDIYFVISTSLSVAIHLNHSLIISKSLTYVSKTPNQSIIQYSYSYNFK